MGLPHLQPGEVINLHNCAERFPEHKTFAVVKTEHLEVLRFVIEAGKTIPAHQVPGEITVQCLYGELTFSIEDESKVLKPGDWLYLGGGQLHALSANQESILLVTILLP